MDEYYKVWIEMWLELFTITYWLFFKLTMILKSVLFDDMMLFHQYTSELTSKYKEKVSNFLFCKKIAANVVYKYLHKNS